ncbi:hypothetical protein SLE2022_137120 [Rubroshorea leprosula]
MERDRVRARSAAARDDSGSRRWQGHRRVAGSVYQSQRQTKTFFFYNFPEKCGTGDLWNCFRRFGKVTDVYVPEKRDKWGKRFGFVHLLGVKNEYQMERSLNEIWIGTFKVRVRLAEDRYRRKIGSGKASHADLGKGKVSNVGRLVQPGQSYAQAVVEGYKSQAEGSNGRERSVSEKAKEVLADNGEMVVNQHVGEMVGTDAGNAGAGRMANEEEESKKGEFIEFTPLQEEVHWLEGSMVVVVKALAALTAIQERMDVDGGLLSLLPLGGRQFLLIERVQGYLSEYRQQNTELFDLWFESIQPWAEASQSTGRMIWVRITGVPLKAWSVRCFEKIGESVGEVIRIHEDTKNRAILSEGRVLVVSPETGKISKSITLQVDEQLFAVTVVEEEWRTDPD